MGARRRGGGGGGGRGGRVVGVVVDVVGVIVGNDRGCVEAFGGFWRCLGGPGVTGDGLGVFFGGCHVGDVNTAAMIRHGYGVCCDW